MFVAFAIFMGVTFACRHSESPTNTSEKVLIKVEKDAHVSRVAKSLSVDKGRELGFTELKGMLEKDASPILFDPGFECAKITLDNATGTEITDSNKHKFNSNATIFVLSKPIADWPVMSRLRVGEKVKERDEITSVMEFVVSSELSEVEIDVETTPLGASVEYVPTIDNGKLTLAKDITELKIKVAKDGKESEYTVRVKKSTLPKKLISILFVQSGKKKGKLVQASTEDITKILEGDDAELELLGNKASIIMGSMQKRWTKVVVNGRECTWENGRIVPYGGYKAAVAEDVFLSKKGEVTNVNVTVEAESEATSFSFKVKRLDDSADIPADKMFIRDKNVVTDWNLEKIIDDEQKPKFAGSEPCTIEVRCHEDAIGTVKINDEAASVEEKKDKKGNSYWALIGKVEGVKDAGANGKDVTIVMEPKDSETYHTTKWTFCVTYEDVDDMKVETEINGKKISKLPNDFANELKQGKNPLVNIEAAHLNLKLTCSGTVKNIVINDGSNEVTVGEDKLLVDGKNYILKHSLPISSTPKNITVKINPADEAVYKPITYRFRAAGTGALEKIEPKFVSISEDTNFPKATFLDKLEGAEVPLFKVASETADILITLTPYEAEFLCERKAKVNESEEEIRLLKTYAGTFYILAKRIPIKASEPTNVKVEFIAKAGLANHVTWTFAVQGGKDKPSFPQSFLTFFRINGVGSPSNPLPSSLTEHLIDEVNPVYVFDMKNGKAEVEVGCYKPTLIKNIEFKMDGEKKHEASPSQVGSTFTSKYAFVTGDQAPHPVEIIVYPQDDKYTPLTLKFKLQWSGKNAQLLLTFGINGKIQQNGYKGALKAETAQLLVQAKEDVIQEVKIGEEGNQAHCDIVTFPGNLGTVYQATKNVSLMSATGEVEEKTFVITVTPKDTSEWAETICKFHLKGTKIDDDNAEFLVIKNASGKEEADIDTKVEWKAGFEDSRYAENYFTTAVILVARTVNPRATVMYRIVDLDGKDIQGKDASAMQKDLGEHTSEKITFFTDKPTRVKAWVVSPTNKTNEKKGTWFFTFNPLPLKWGYKDKENGADYESDNKAYDVIEVEEAKLGQDKKIYLVFAPWNEQSGYSVALDAVSSPHQGALTALEGKSYFETYYKSAVDVSSLFGTSAVSELPAQIKIMNKDGTKTCFIYEIKIKKKV